MMLGTSLIPPVMINLGIGSFDHHEKWPLGRPRENSLLFIFEWNAFYKLLAQNLWKLEKLCLGGLLKGKGLNSDRSTKVDSTNHQMRQ